MIQKFSLQSSERFPIILGEQNSSQAQPAHMPGQGKSL